MVEPITVSFFLGATYSWAYSKFLDKIQSIIKPENNRNISQRQLRIYSYESFRKALYDISEKADRDQTLTSNLPRWFEDMLKKIDKDYSGTVQKWIKKIGIDKVYLSIDKPWSSTGIWQNYISVLVTRTKLRPFHNILNDENSARSFLKKWFEYTDEYVTRQQDPQIQRMVMEDNQNLMLKDVQELSEKVASKDDIENLNQEMRDLKRSIARREECSITFHKMIQLLQNRIPLKLPGIETGYPTDPLKKYSPNVLIGLKEIISIIDITNADSEICSIEQHLNSDWNSQRVYFLIGNFYYFVDDFQKANDHYDLLSTIDPNEVLIENNEAAFDYSILHFNWGATLRILGKLEESIKKYKKAIEYRTNFAAAFSNLGNILGELGKPEEAIENYKMAIECKPDFAEPYYNWGVTLSRIGKLEEAIEKYKLAIKFKPADEIIYSNWGAALAEQGKQDEAIEKFVKAIEFNPKLARAYSNWGNSLIELGKLEEAIEKFSKAVEYKPDEALTYSHWGAALLTLGKLEEAIEKFSKATELKPDDVEAYSLWGAALLTLGKLEEAIEKFSKAIVLKPDDAEVYSNWGLALSRLGKLEDAIEKYEKAILCKPDFVEAYSNWGVTLHKLGIYNEAIEKYKTVIEYKPDDAATYSNWGETLVRLGKLEEAIEKYKKAIDYQPDVAEFYYNLARVNSSLNMEDECLANLKIAIKLNKNFREIATNDRAFKSLQDIHSFKHIDPPIETMKRRVEKPGKGVEWYEIEFTSNNYESGKFKFVTQANHLENNAIAIGHQESTNFQIVATIIINAEIVIDARKVIPYRANIALGKVKPIIISFYKIPNDINIKKRMVFEILFENWVIKSCMLEGSNLTYLADEGFG